MSDEEKEAIEWLKRLVKINKRDNLDNTFAEILLNLIEKQAKEIEELKKKNKKYTIHLSDKQYNDAIKLAKSVETGKWNDKIKAKIEELKKYRDKFDEGNMLQDVIIKQNQIQVLQSLLEKE